MTASENKAKKRSWMDAEASVEIGRWCGSCGPAPTKQLPGKQG